MDSQEALADAEIAIAETEMTGVKRVIEIAETVTAGIVIAETETMKHSEAFFLAEKEKCRFSAHVRKCR